MTLREVLLIIALNLDLQYMLTIEAYPFFTEIITMKRSTTLNQQERYYFTKTVNNSKQVISMHKCNTETSCSRCGCQLGTYEFNRTQTGVVCDNCFEKVKVKPSEHPLITFALGFSRFTLLICVILVPIVLVLLLKFIWFVAGTF